MNPWNKRKLAAGIVSMMVATVSDGPILRGQAITLRRPDDAPATQAAPATQPGQALGIRFATGPADGVEAVKSALKGALPNLARASRGSAVSTNIDSMQVMPPLAIYDLPVTRMVNDGDMKDARAIGFEYYVRAADKSGVQGVAIAANSEGRAQMTRTSARTVADAAVRALDHLAKLDEVKKRSYEGTLLQIQGLFPTGPLQVIWLKADAPGADLFYPPASPNPNIPAPGGLQHERLYTADEFVKAVTEVYQRQQANPNRGRQGLRGGSGG